MLFHMLPRFGRASVTSIFFYHFYYFYLSTYNVPTTDYNVFTNDDTYHATQQQQNETDANCAKR